MHIYINQNWQDGFLDFCRQEGEVRVEVRAFRPIETISEAYFEPERSFSKIFRYIYHVGFLTTLRKVFSRLQETGRNEKYLACGVGEVVEAPEEGSLQKGDAVTFLAPRTSIAQRLVLPPELIEKREDTDFLREGNLLYYSNQPSSDFYFDKIKSWSRFSSEPLPENIEKFFSEAERIIDNTSWDAAKKLPIEEEAEITETSEAPADKSSKDSAALFGYGHYARVHILPQIKKHLDLERIHEIDSTLIPTDSFPETDLDTSPYFRVGEDYKAAFIAGYHHHHARLSAEALSRDIYAVSEKPLAVSWDDLELLENALEETPTKFFSGFHKRYLPFNDYIFKDLEITKGEPLNFHAFVYEVPVPENHWYSWKISGPRFLQDGCHWVDYFLYLNDFSKPENIEVNSLEEETTAVTIKLSNGAVGTITLTTKGSSRIGVQDYIELRTEDATARMKNSTHYEAETHSSKLREEKISKGTTYNKMYTQIAESIANGEPGDDKDNILTSAETVLTIADELES